MQSFQCCRAADIVLLNPVPLNQSTKPSTDQETHSAFMDVYQHSMPKASGALDVVWTMESFDSRYSVGPSSSTQSLGIDGRSPPPTK